MSSKSIVEAAHQKSRIGAIANGGAGIVYLAHSLFGTPDATLVGLKWTWAITSVFLLLLLSVGGGAVLYRARFLAFGRTPWSQLYPLIIDEVTQSNKKTALMTGYWIAILTAIAFYLPGGLSTVTSQEGMHTVVSVSIAAALLAFAFLELRTYRDA